MVKYVTVSIPKALGDDIDKLIEKIGYWPSKGAFVREAVISKIRQERLESMDEFSGEQKPICFGSLKVTVLGNVTDCEFKEECLEKYAELVKSATSR